MRNIAAYSFLCIFMLACNMAYAGGSPIFYAAESGNLESVESLIKDGIKIDFRDDDGNTALMYASKEGKLEVVKFLVKHGANINVKNNSQVTPLIFASENGHFPVVRYLVDKGADTNVYAYNKSNGTAYQAAEILPWHLQILYNMIIDYK